MVTDDNRTTGFMVTDDTTIMATDDNQSIMVTDDNRTTLWLWMTTGLHYGYG